MLAPPPISEAELASTLQTQYGLEDLSLAFLPLGADLATAVYRATTRAGSRYFVKIRFGPFDEISALLPAWLAEQGIGEIIAPLPALSGRPFASTTGFTLLVYPFVGARDAYEVVLSDSQWIEFGRAMRQIHDAPVRPDLASRIPREEYDPKWRVALRNVMEQVDVTVCEDEIRRRFVEFMEQQRGNVLALVDSAEDLANVLRTGELPLVVCHTDLHPGNLLVADDGRLFIVDWDAPLLAPRERDLMYPGGAQGYPGRTPEEEEALFYRGYGETAVDLGAVAYYRLQRIIEDLAVISAQLLVPLGDAQASGEADREQALGWAMSNFLPGHTLEIANRALRLAAESRP